MESERQENSYPLSLNQKNIWDLECAIKGTSVNNICTTIHIEGRLDCMALQKSINEVVRMDPVLRTRIFLKDGRLYQRHVSFVWEDFPIYDFTDSGAEGVVQWEKAMTGESVPVLEGPLYRFALFRQGEDRGGVVVKVHHIISDGWSQVLLCSRIGRTYLDFLAGKESCLEESPDYCLHVEEEQKYLASAAYDRDARYWRGILEQCGEPSVLKECRGAALSPVGRRLSFELPQVLNHAVASFCLENQVSPFAVFYMALAVYFKRTGGADGFTIGVPVVNRTNYQFKNSMGMFVSTLPFYNVINDEWTFREFNGKLMENWYELLRHQRFPFSHIGKMAGGMRGQGGKLFHIVFSYQDSKIFESTDSSVLLSGSWHYSGYQSEQLCIHLTNLRDDGCFRVDYDYLTQLFTAGEVERLHSSLCGILAEALENQDKPLYQLRLLSPAEQEKVLYTFNRTQRAVPGGTVGEALAEEAGRHADRAALICCGKKMTYGELMERSRRVTDRIPAGKGLAAVLLPRGFELVEAMVGILGAGYAYLLLSPDLPAGRIRKILERSGADLLVTSRNSAGDAGFPAYPVPCLFVEDLHQPDMAGPVPDCGSGGGPEVTPEDLAYVVYTSGSTGEPKGVEITHRGVRNLACAMKDIYGSGAVLSVCGLGFDAFMLESIAALLNGRTIVLPEEEDLESPACLADMISRFAVGFFSMTPSRLTAFLRNPAFRDVMCRMEAIVCGGEVFPPELLKQLREVSRARIYNQYGPSEATVAVSMKELTCASRITAGAPMTNCRLYVLDRRRRPLPLGVYGELYVGGVCVGRGYRNDPQLTAARFFPSPFENGEMLYATGDLACWTEEGEIMLAGRIDRQVKLRGLRVEPQEAAACIASHPLVREAAARTWEIGGQTLLAVYYCSDAEVAETELLTYAAGYLPRYLIPSCLVRLDSMPVNANGKIQEDRLPRPDAMDAEDKKTGGRPEAVPDRNGSTAGGAAGAEKNKMLESGTVEQAVLDIFRKKLERPDLKPDDDYFMSGGNSLNAMETISGIQEATGITIRVADMYACRTASRLASCLAEKGARSHKEAWLKKAPENVTSALSPMQQGIYVQSCLDPTGLAYHMPGAFRLAQEPDGVRLEEAFRRLIQADPVLRCAFVQGTEGISVRIEEEVHFSLDRLEGRNFAEACAAFVRPFDLGKAPLLRAALWQEEGGAWYLFLDSHHIIGDGMSTSILLNRLNDEYCGRTASVPYSYQDYVFTVTERQNRRKGAQEEKERPAAYWKEHLQDLPGRLTLPADFARPRRFDFHGKEYQWMMSREESRACREYCRSRGMSPFVLFLAAYGVLLSGVGTRQDFVVGTPAAGRLHPGTDGICGPFINTLPLRLKPEGGKMLCAYLEEVRAEVNGMLDHQQTSLEEILAGLNLPRGEQNPLYSLMFTQSPVDTGSFMLGDQPVEYVPVSTGTVKMDLTAELADQAGAFCVTFTYASGLFLEETIAFYARCLKQILHQILSGEDRRLEELNVLSPQDQEKYVDLPNFRTTPFINLPIHYLIEKRNIAEPGAPAVIFHGKTVTRGELESRAAGIACLLQEAGITPGQCVGLGFSRTPDLLAAMEGILKTGCAYVPLLPSFPEARLTYMLKTAGAGIVLCDGETAKKLPQGLDCRILTAGERQTDKFEAAPVRDEDLVNVMFTSGSTGKPKGVMLKHRSVSSLFASIRELLMRAGGPVLCTTNVVFDSFIGESLFPLAMGRTIVLLDEEEMMLPWKLAQAIRETGAEIFQVTPARLQMCLGNDEFCRAAAALKLILLGGEVLTPQLLSRLHEVTDAVTVNMYGPTEATVYMTMTDVAPGDHITIGRPLSNSRIYVLDRKGRPVMPTACGEMYMAGECLAKGYISRPDLTEKAFLPDPFFPGEKMYKSGDLGRLRLDGNYDFLGRMDTQVKLNGQRVEMDEITGAVQESGYAVQAAAVALRREDGSMELCAFYVPASTEDGPEELERKLRGRLKQALPSYMLPSRIIALDRMPLTPSSKTDLQALKRMAEEDRAVEEDRAAEQKEDREGEGKAAQKMDEKEGREGEGKAAKITPDFLLDIWGSVLGRSHLDADLSFFEQGGTSLAALNVLSRYFNEHLEMTLSQFYENPTASGQAQLLGCGREEVVMEMNLNDKDKSGVVLLTGATGFFGAHLLKALLDRGETSEVVCILRDGSKERLFETLSWYFGRGHILRVLKRITVVKGDISAPLLGLSEEEYFTLAGRIGAVYHAAADVSHYTADRERYMRTNVEGTRTLLHLAESAAAPFYYMSTCSVAGEQMKEPGKSAVFTEEDYDIGQRWEDNIYVKSKFLAEGLVREAAADGFPVKIFRLGRLVGRASDGVFQQNPHTNVFWLLMRGFYLAGAMPETAAHARVDLTPVDYSAEAVLALRDQEGLAFHIIHPCPPTAEETAEAMGGGIRIVKDEQFQTILEKEARGPQREALAPLLDYWQRIRNHPPAVRVSCGKTQEQLRRSGFDFSIPSPEILLGSFIQHDLWTVKGD